MAEKDLRSSRLAPSLAEIEALWPSLPAPKL